MIKAVVAGACGRMGMRIISMIEQNPAITLSGAFERHDHPHLNEDAGQMAGLGQLGIKVQGSVSDAIDKGEVLIDFTTPQSTLENVRVASSKGLAMVIGTTGMSGDLLKEVEDLARKTRCVIAPNMSVGVNVMFKMAKEIAQFLGDDYDMEILEVHHRMKKDAPSGTAMRLGQILADATKRNFEKVARYERRGMVGERTDKEIGMQTLRAGDITGEHTVVFGGIGERLELIHRAHNRDNFARGAMRAAIWVVQQTNGVYDMQDVLGLR